MTAGERIAGRSGSVPESFGADAYEEPSRWLDRLRPEEGWLSVPLVVLLAFAMAWSIADARWILGRDDLSSFVLYMAPLAALWGYLSARLEMSRWLAHALGAAIGAFILIEVIGSLMPGASPGVAGWFQATADSVINAYLDLAWRHKISTTQYGHFCLILGIIVWGTAQAAAYDVFGHRRPVNAVLLLAVVLIANMSLTIRDQFGDLVLFTGSALLLLLLTHAADEQTGWLRHRIWRSGEAEAPQLRGGVTFAGIAVVGALVLTTVASSAPLANAWSGMDGNFRDAASWIVQYLPANGGGSRISAGADFGNSSVIQSSFSAPNSPVFTVQVPNANDRYHWRLLTFDVFQSTGWAKSAGPNSVRVDAEAGLDAGTQDEANAHSPGRKKVTLNVTIQDPTLKRLVVPDEPFSTTVPTTVTYAGDASVGTHVAWATTDATSYRVTGYIANYALDGSGLTEWKLRNAGTKYPPGLLQQYTQGVDHVGSYGTDLLNEILTSAPGHPFTNPYDKAKAIQDYLRSEGGFTYSTDISSIVSEQCTGLDTVDCFAKTRIGFCEQFATTMVMLLRMEGIPARYALGYLPGTLDARSLIYQVTRQQQHAWVEAYFPAYGWIEFDPTGGNVGTPTVLPAGSPAPSASPTPAASGGSAPAPRPRFDQGDNGSSGAGGTTGGGGGPPILPIVGGGAIAAGLAIVLFLRFRPRRLDDPNAVYRSVTRLAAFIGYRPGPTQTVYEYVGTLGSQVPEARASLELVATAKVEVTYGRRELDVERLRSLAEARATLRRALVWLAVRRPRLPARLRRRLRR